MGRKRAGRGVDPVWSGHYAPHLTGTGYEIQRESNPQLERQARIERMYMRILGEMAMNRFEWKGLPDSVDVRYLELTLYYQALSCFYFDTTVDQYLALQGAPVGPPNFAMNPTAFMITGNSTFTSKTLSAREVVPIWANYMRMPDTDVVYIYSGKLAELDRTIEINSKAARQTKVLAVTENQRLTGRNYARMIDEGQPLIEINADGFMGERLDQLLTAIDMGGDPLAIEKLHILRTRLWGEVMGLLGIDFANQDKKERLVADEVDANQEQIFQMQRVNLNARQAAAREINKRWPNLNVSVDYYQSEVATVPNPLAADGDTGSDGAQSVDMGNGYTRVSPGGN